MYTSGKAGLSSSEVTWPKILQSHKYITQAVGKWHLGWDEDSYGDQKHGPLGHGFDNFYGLPFTLVDGIEKNDPFFTYENIHQVSYKKMIPFYMNIHCVYFGEYASWICLFLPMKPVNS